MQISEKQTRCYIQQITKEGHYLDLFEDTPYDCGFVRKIGGHFVHERSDEFTFFPSYSIYKGSFVRSQDLTDELSEGIKKIMYASCQVRHGLFPVNMHLLKDRSESYVETENRLTEAGIDLGGISIQDSFEWNDVDAQFRWVIQIYFAGRSFIITTSQMLDNLDKIISEMIIKIYSEIDKEKYISMLRELEKCYKAFKEAQGLEDEERLNKVKENLEQVDMVLDKFDDKFRQQLDDWCRSNRFDSRISAKGEKVEMLIHMFTQRMIGEMWTDPGNWS